MVDHAPRYPSNDPDFEHYAEQRSSHPVASYQVGPSLRDSHAERSVPLFLSDRDGVPDPSEYMPSLLKGQGSYYASRILAGALGGIALAGMAALVSSDSARDFFASAKASSVAALSVASVAMQPAATPSTPPSERQAASIQPPPAENQAPPATIADGNLAGGSAASGSTAPGTITVAAVTPSGDDVRAAYQGAQQGSAPQAAAAPDVATPAEPVHHLDAGEIASLLKRAEALIGNGDLAAARLVLRRAAEAGDARAAMMLGGTYDPTVLGKLGVRGVVPDFATARSWYEKAKRFGGSEAAPQLDLLAKKQN
jgi:TPR repeat protein